MSLAIVCRLLNDAIGLDVASVGEAVVDDALRERQQVCNLTGLDAYIRHLQQSGNELQELIEAVIVPETWFFRDREAFAALSHRVLPEWLMNQPEGPMRLLTVPCATGEEPYSTAMALMDGGLAATRFQIDAVDISQRLLTIARRGIYGRRAFRGRDLAFRDRFFLATPTGHQLIEAVRQQVTFRHGNLLSIFARADEPYDVVFCRNLLIYFDTASQARALATVANLLKPGGVLFVGAAETGVLLNHGFESANWPMTFAFRKSVVPLRQAALPSTSLSSMRQRPRSSVPRRSVAVGARRAKKPEELARPPGDLPEAQRLADQGRLAEASAACEDYLRLHEPSAQVFYLLGLVRDASGDADAAEVYYRKALYLDPCHGEAVMHLALLMDRGERTADALVLRNRAKRLMSRGV
jgi:chemotaxis protein methyltransferase WspC